MSLRAPIVPRLASPDAERASRSLVDSVRELQALPAASAKIVAGVALADGVDTTIAHGLGRAPVWIRESTPRSATPTALGATGRVQEIRDGKYDRRKIIVLRASGWGATILVDLEVM